MLKHVDPWQMVKSILAPFSNPKISITTSDPLPGNPIIDIPYELVKLTLENLISNALKYTKTSIHIEITLNTNTQPAELIFKIIDDGPPFPSIELNTLSHEKRPSETGSGIGLAACRQALTKVLGDKNFELSFHNTPQKEVRLKLKISKIEHQPSLGNISESNKPIVIIIEDQSFNQNIANAQIIKESELLKKGDYDLIFVASTGIADTFIEKYLPRIAFIGSDIHLADSASPNGETYIKDIKTTCPQATRAITSSSPPKKPRPSISHTPLYKIDNLIKKIEDAVEKFKRNDCKETTTSIE